VVQLALGGIALFFKAFDLVHSFFLTKSMSGERKARERCENREADEVSTSSSLTGAEADQKHAATFTALTAASTPDAAALGEDDNHNDGDDEDADEDEYYGNGDNDSEEKRQDRTSAKKTKLSADETAAAGSKTKAKRKRRKSSEIKKKPRDMPRRPLSAYNIFFREERARVLQEREAELLNHQERRGKPDPELFATLGKTIASRWKRLEPDAREQYQSEAKDEMKRYRKEMEGYQNKKKSGRLAAQEPHPPSKLSPPESVAGNERGLPSTSNQSYFPPSTLQDAKLDDRMLQASDGLLAEGGERSNTQLRMLAEGMTPIDATLPLGRRAFSQQQQQQGQLSGAQGDAGLGQAQIVPLSHAKVPDFFNLQQHQQTFQTQYLDQLLRDQQSYHPSSSMDARMLAMQRSPFSQDMHQQHPDLLLGRMIPTQVAAAPFSQAVSRGFGGQPQQVPFSSSSYLVTQIGGGTPMPSSLPFMNSTVMSQQPSSEGPALFAQSVAFSSQYPGWSQQQQMIMMQQQEQLSRHLQSSADGSQLPESPPYVQNFFLRNQGHDLSLLRGMEEFQQQQQQQMTLPANTAADDQQLCEQGIRGSGSTQK